MLKFPEEKLKEYICILYRSAALAAVKILPWKNKGPFIVRSQYYSCWWFGVDIALPESWGRHQMETFSALLAFCKGNHQSRWIPLKKSVTRSFDVFFDMRLNKWLCKQLRRRWFDTPSSSLWRHCNEWSSFGPRRLKLLLLKTIRPMT